MATYPTLTSPVCNVEKETVDLTIRTEARDGRVVTGIRKPRDIQRWSLEYPILYAADSTSLYTFYNTTVRQGADYFDWTTPEGETLNVRFATPVVFSLLVKRGGEITYKTNRFTLEEV